jgi:hypothetical protein
VNGQILKDIKQKVRDKMNYYSPDDPNNASNNPAATINNNNETASFEAKDKPDQVINPNKLPPINVHR